MTTLPFADAICMGESGCIEVVVNAGCAGWRKSIFWTEPAVAA